MPALHARTAELNTRQSNYSSSTCTGAITIWMTAGHHIPASVLGCADEVVEQDSLCRIV
jgi:hypothetical protein